MITAQQFIDVKEYGTEDKTLIEINNIMRFNAMKGLVHLNKFTGKELK